MEYALKDFSVGFSDSQNKSSNELVPLIQEKVLPKYEKL